MVSLRRNHSFIAYNTVCNKTNKIVTYKADESGKMNQNNKLKEAIQIYSGNFLCFVTIRGIISIIYSKKLIRAK